MAKLDAPDRVAAAVPFRFWRQYAHLVVPATSVELVRKALERGTASTGRLLASVGGTTRDLADALEVPEWLVRELLEHPIVPPVVVIDGEDGLPPGETAARQAVDIIGESLARTSSGRHEARGGSLIFYRMSSLDERSAIADVRRLLGRLATGGQDGLGLDGLVVPKVRSASGLEELSAELGSIEQEHGLLPGSLRILVLVESAVGLARIDEVAEATGDRLAGLIFGAVDYAADLGLSTTALDHPVALRARIALIGAAARSRVPAIDGMTLALPVLDPAVDSGSSRTAFVERLALAFREATDALQLGMVGKWVGHPAQLFAAALAVRAAYAPERISDAVDQVVAYEAAVSDGRGVTMIGRTMADRATARLASAWLRRATAAECLPTEQAEQLGVISHKEAADLRTVTAPNGVDER
jgi:citrate lyase beta subunit